MTFFPLRWDRHSCLSRAAVLRHPYLPSDADIGNAPLPHPMQLALPALAHPDLELPGLLRLAGEHRLAVELHASRDARTAVATNLLFTDAAKVRSALADAGMSLATVWATVPLGIPAMVADELTRIAHAAATAGCGVVRLIESRPTAPATLRAAGRAAAAANVQLTLDNAPLRNGVSDLWRRLDAVDHPSVGCCLDTGNAAVGGDGPSLSIPTLARRIVHVRLRHPATDAEAVHRLAGIGYAGWLSVDATDRAATVRSWLAAGPVGK